MRLKTSRTQLRAPSHLAGGSFDLGPVRAFCWSRLSRRGGPCTCLTGVCGSELVSMPTLLETRPKKMEKPSCRSLDSIAGVNLFCHGGHGKIQIAECFRAHVVSRPRTRAKTRHNCADSGRMKVFADRTLRFLPACQLDGGTTRQLLKHASKLGNAHNCLAPRSCLTRGSDGRLQGRGRAL